MRVFIAEKPSLGRAIAAALPRPHTQHAGYIQTGEGDIITWCIGHLLEQVPPDAYHPRYKRWTMHDLPIIPERWKLAPRKNSAKQLAVVRKILKSATSLVHAGDPDREGQLLVDEVIHYLKYPVARNPIQRLLLRDLNPSAVKRALSQMRSNREFAPLSVSALARSRADWLYGMNMSRAYTLLGQQAGYEGVLSVGRVQTPILGLVVRRDQEIENFVVTSHYQVDAHIRHEARLIIARWEPSDACIPWQDESGRVLVRALAEKVVAKITGQPATVVESKRNQSKQAPPLPYSLSILQIDAAKRFSMSAADVLSTCQSLYEKHKVITYPRSDCRYLPEEHFGQAAQLCQTIAQSCSKLASAAANADMSIRSKTWNDSKVTAHHAIIPTPKKVAANSLSRREEQVYELIARQYLLQFYKPAITSNARLRFTIAGGSFVANTHTLIDPGWRTLFPPPKKSDSQHSSAEGTQADLPDLAVGSVLPCEKGVVLDKKTEPPKPFTEATLLQATTGIARYVKNEALRKILRDTDGIGTEATRASIFETLFRRQLLLRRGSSIHASEAGKGLIAALPVAASYPDMTAEWEQKLGQIAQGNFEYQPFMQALQEHLAGLMSNVQDAQAPESLRGLKTPATYSSKKGKRQRKR